MAVVLTTTVVAAASITTDPEAAEPHAAAPAESEQFVPVENVAPLVLRVVMSRSVPDVPLLTSIIPAAFLYSAVSGVS